MNDKKLDINEYEHHISELQTIIRDREREIINTNDKLRQLENNFDVEIVSNIVSYSYSFVFFKSQQLELKKSRQQYDILNVNLNISTEENAVRKIKLIRKKLQGFFSRVI